MYTKYDGVTVWSDIVEHFEKMEFLGTNKKKKEK